MSSNFKYDAFISYRHCQPDQFVAENLHKQLETFKLPSNVAKKLRKADPEAKTKITRVFRDQEELPLAANLADPIVDALKESEWLIVICSPRLKESMWCKREIETFISLHGRDHVMAVLVEGEPDESFPEELLHRDVEVVRPDGTKEIVSEPCEPLAADVRADNDSDRLKAIKNEIIRLLAPVFGLDYDELRQRHRERKIRRMLTIAVVVAVVSILFGLVSTLSAITINKQANQIKEQATEIENQNATLKVKQAESLAEESLGLLKIDDRRGAIEKAYQALTTYEGIEMPYTDSARNALVRSLRPYDLTGSARAEYDIKTKGIVEDIIASPLKTELLIADSSGTVTIWSLESQEVLTTFNLDAITAIDDYVWFKDEDILFYTDGSSIFELNVKSGDKKELVNNGIASFVSRIRYDGNKDVIYVSYGNSIAGYNAADGNQCFSYNLSDSSYASGKIRLLGSEYIAFNETADSHDIVKVINLNGEELFSTVLDDEESYQTCYMADGKIYVLGERTTRNSNGTITGSASELRAFSFEDGSELWKREDLGIFGEKLCEITEDDGKFLIEVGKKGIIQVNENDGSLVVSETYASEKILWAGLTEKAVIYLTSAPMEMYLTGHSTMGFTKTIDNNISNFSLGETMADGYMMVPDNSNRVIYYTVSTEDIAEEYAGVLDERETVVLNPITDGDAIAEFGLPNQELIANIAMDDNNRFICESGKDGMVRIYDASSKELLTEFELAISADYIDSFYGEDSEGNLYWGGDIYGYCVSPDNNLIAVLAMLRGVDKEGNKLIFGSTSLDELYSAPIFTTEDLIKRAEAYLEP